MVSEDGDRRCGAMVSLMSIAVVCCLVSGTDGFITSARPPRRLASGYFGATPRLRASERPWRSSGLFRSGGGRTDQGRKAVVGGVGWGTVVVSAAAGRGRRLEGLRMITLDVVNDSEIPAMAEFFVSNFWEEDIGPSQKRPLVRELVTDYRNRYGALMGPRKLQSLLMAARDKGEIVGCVAIEVSVCAGERVGLKARGINPSTPGVELRPVLANLAVARSARRRGLAKRLVKRCEEAAKEWGYDEVLLLVEENNSRARRLYQKIGYRTLFKDNDARKIVPSDYAIKELPCTNVCMRRELNANIFAGLFKMMAR